MNLLQNILLVVFQTVVCFYKNCIYLLQCIYKSEIKISDSGARVIKIIVTESEKTCLVYTQILNTFSEYNFFFEHDAH